MACDCYVLFAINILRFLELCNPKAHSIFRPLGEFCVVFEHMSVLQCIFRKIIQLTRTAAELYYVLIRIVLYYVLFLYYVLCNPARSRPWLVNKNQHPPPWLVPSGTGPAPPTSTPPLLHAFQKTARPSSWGGGSSK